MIYDSRKRGTGREGEGEERERARESGRERGTERGRESERERETERRKGRGRESGMSPVMHTKKNMRTNIISLQCDKEYSIVQDNGK